MLSPGFAKSGAEANDKFPESEIVNKELSIPLLDKVTSSPSASIVDISTTLDWPFVTSILEDRSTNVGALSFRLVIVSVNSGDVADNSPSEAITFKL